MQARLHSFAENPMASAQSRGHSATSPPSVCPADAHAALQPHPSKMAPKTIV